MASKNQDRSAAPNKREKLVFRKWSNETARQPGAHGETPGEAHSCLPLGPQGAGSSGLGVGDPRPQAAQPQTPVTQGRGFPTGPSFPQTWNEGLDTRTLSGGPGSSCPFLLSVPPTELAQDPGQSKIDPHGSTQAWVSLFVMFFRAQVMSGATDKQAELSHRTIAFTLRC